MAVPRVPKGPASHASHPKPTYEPHHRPFVRVPSGGSSCASCVYIYSGDDDQPKCRNKHYIAWNNGDESLPTPVDAHCSDWYVERGSKESEG